MRSRTKILLFSGAVLILGVLYTVLMWSFPVYHYTSSDGGFQEIEVPWKGRRFDLVLQQFEKYRNAGPSDAVLMRTFERRWSSPNLWPDNLTHERWRLPLAPKGAAKS